MALNMVFLGQYSVCTSDDCVFCSCWVECFINIRSRCLRVFKFSILLADFSAHLVLSFRKGIEFCSNCGYVYPSLHFYQFLLNIFWSSLYWVHKPLELLFLIDQWCIIYFTTMMVLNLPPWPDLRILKLECFNVAPLGKALSLESSEEGTKNCLFLKHLLKVIDLGISI